MLSPAKILHILNHSYPYADGYAIRSFNIINAQRRYGNMDPIVLTSPKHEPEVSQNPERFEDTLYYRTESSSGILPANMSVVSVLYRQIQHIYRQYQFDLIHAHSPSLCGLAAMLFSWRTNIPFVYEVRAFWEDAAVDTGRYAAGSLKYRMTRFLESLVLRRASAVTTIATHLKRDINARRRKQGNVFLVPNGVDCDRFQPRSPDKSLQEELALDDIPVIGFIGSFYRFEGLDILLKALALLKEQGVPYKAILVGGGEMDRDWRELAEDLKLTDVLFTGRVPHSEVLRYYSVFDVCVYPRLREQITELVTPLKPLEAMAMEKLTIGSDVGGIRELLADGKGGILFPAEKPEALAHILKDVLHSPSKYQGVIEAGRKIVNDRFSWASHIERYQKIYDIVRL